MLSEFKNVSKLSLTKQLRDYAAIAEKSGRTFELYVREGAQLTKPLLDFISEHGIQVKVFK